MRLRSLQFWLALALFDALAAWNTTEEQVIDACLERFGGLNYDNAKRLDRYKEWSDTYEEIPCFSKCYVSKTYDFYDETNGFNRRKVVAQFGQPLYNACSEQLTQQEGNSCQLVYNAFHCLVSLENDPLILIESMQNLTMEAKTAMKECLVQFDEQKWPRIKDYGTFPVLEPIPCFTQCFIGKLRLFNERTHRWNLDAMHATLGVPLANARTVQCRRRNERNRCMIIYKQFTCYVLAK